MNDRKYYCLEIYKTTNGQNSLQGIAMSDVMKSNKKLYLKPDYKYPPDYAEHVMYLFKGDYIQHYNNKNELDYCGYYMSLKNINRNMIYTITDNVKTTNNKTIVQDGRYIKLNVGILGEITGYNNGDGIKCGEPLSYLKVNE